MQNRIGRTAITEEDYDRAFKLVTAYLKKASSIKNQTLRELTGLNYDQAIKFFARAVRTGPLDKRGHGSGTHYVMRAKN